LYPYRGFHIKYQNISDLLDKSDLSARRIAGINGHSVNTVRKIENIKSSVKTGGILQLNITFLNQSRNL
jgi:hypothetical protein